MSHKQGKGLQDAIFWTCNHNLPTNAYDCTGSVKKKCGPNNSQARMEEGVREPYPLLLIYYCLLPESGSEEVGLQLYIY